MTIARQLEPELLPPLVDHELELHLNERTLGDTRTTRSTPGPRKRIGVRSVAGGSERRSVSVPRVRPLSSGQTVIEPVRASQPSMYRPEASSDRRGVPVGFQSSKPAPFAIRAALDTSARTP